MARAHAGEEETSSGAVWAGPFPWLIAARSGLANISAADLHTAAQSPAEGATSLTTVCWGGGGGRGVLVVLFKKNKKYYTQAQSWTLTILTR